MSFLAWYGDAADICWRVGPLSLSRRLGLQLDTQLSAGLNEREHDVEPAPDRASICGKDSLEDRGCDHRRTNDRIHAEAERLYRYI